MQLDDYFDSSPGRHPYQGAPHRDREYSCMSTSTRGQTPRRSRSASDAQPEQVYATIPLLSAQQDAVSRYLTDWLEIASRRVKRTTRRRPAFYESAATPGTEEEQIGFKVKAENA